MAKIVEKRRIRRQRRIPTDVLDSILKSSALAYDELFRPYNPITGENAFGLRAEVRISDFLAGQTLYVPVEMFTDTTFCAIVNLGSISAWIHRYAAGGDADKMREALLRHIIRLRCKHDFLFFAYAYARIKNKDGGPDIPFYLRPAQRKLVKVFERMRLNNEPIRVILLKCRQWGGSTATDIYMGWIQIFWKTSWNSNIVGHQSTSATQVFDMYAKLINALPLWLFYDLGAQYSDNVVKLKGSSSTQNIKYMVPRSCKIQTGSARNPESVRAADTSMAHITEEAFFPNTTEWTPAKVVKAGISGIDPKPFTFIVRESTPNGRENEFHDEWVRAGQVDKDGKKVSAFYQVFVAWHEIEGYTKAFESDEEKLDFAEWLWLNREDTTGEGSYYWWLYESCHASLESINWYVTKRKEYNSLDDMKQEYPSDDIEAFLYSGISVFDPYKIDALESGTQVPPVFVGDIEGSNPSPENVACMDNLHLVESPSGAFRIFDMPDDSEHIRNRYVVSCDIGGANRTSDFSDIVVFDRYDLMYGGIPSVVAEWHGHCYPDQLAQKCAQIAKFYNDAFLVVENNTAYSRMNNVEGDSSELFFPILIELYDNLFNSSHSKLFKHRQKETKWGFNTNRSTKQAIIKNYQKIVRDLAYVEREPEALNEMSYFAYDKQHNTFSAIPGKHDDRIMARAIGLWVSGEMDLPTVVVTKSPEERERERLLRRKPSAIEVAGL